VWRPPFCPSAVNGWQHGQQSITQARRRRPRAWDSTARRRLMQQRLKRPAGLSSSAANASAANRFSFGLQRPLHLRYSIAHQQSHHGQRLQMAGRHAGNWAQQAHATRFQPRPARPRRPEQAGHTTTFDQGRPSAMEYTVARRGCSSNRSGAVRGKPVLGQDPACPRSATDRFQARCPKPRVSFKPGGYPMVHQALRPSSFRVSKATLSTANVFAPEYRPAGSTGQQPMHIPTNA